MSTIADALLNLSTNKDDDADVTFVVHGQEVKAHKCILCARSEALKAMINSDLAPPDGRHLVADEKITAEDFKEFLKFLYLDECHIDNTNFGALLHMSQMYFVPLLKKKCFDHIEALGYNFDGIFKWCEYGIIYENECPDLLELCFKKLSQETWGSQLLYCEEKLISAELVERIAKYCPRSGYLTEETLFVKIFEWGKEQCKQQKVQDDSNGIKRVISPILKHIKLESISVHSWIYTIQPNELAPQEECYEVIADYAKIYPDRIMYLTPKMMKDDNGILGDAVRVGGQNSFFPPRGPFGRGGQRRR